ASRKRDMLVVRRHVSLQAEEGPKAMGGLVLGKSNRHCQGSRPCAACCMRLRPRLSVPSPTGGAASRKFVIFPGPLPRLAGHEIYLNLARFWHFPFARRPMLGRFFLMRPNAAERIVYWVVQRLRWGT